MGKSYAQSVRQAGRVVNNGKACCDRFPLIPKFPEAGGSGLVILKRWMYLAKVAGNIQRKGMAMDAVTAGAAHTRANHDAIPQSLSNGGEATQSVAIPTTTVDDQGFIKTLNELDQRFEQLLSRPLARPDNDGAMQALEQLWRSDTVQDKRIVEVLNKEAEHNPVWDRAFQQQVRYVFGDSEMATAFQDALMNRVPDTILACRELLRDFHDLVEREGMLGLMETMLQDALHSFREDVTPRFLLRPLLPLDKIDKDVHLSLEARKLLHQDIVEHMIGVGAISAVWLLTWVRDEANAIRWACLALSHDWERLVHEITPSLLATAPRLQEPRRQALRQRYDDNRECFESSEIRQLHLSAVAETQMYIDQEFDNIISGYEHDEEEQTDEPSDEFLKRMMRANRQYVRESDKLIQAYRKLRKAGVQDYCRQRELASGVITCAESDDPWDDPRFLSGRLERLTGDVTFMSAIHAGLCTGRRKYLQSGIEELQKLAEQVKDIGILAVPGMTCLEAILDGPEDMFDSDSLQEYRRSVRVLSLRMSLLTLSWVAEPSLAIRLALTLLRIEPNMYMEIVEERMLSDEA